MPGMVKIVILSCENKHHLLLSRTPERQLVKLKQDIFDNSIIFLLTSDFDNCTVVKLNILEY